ncbi:hypothetical protein PtB15_16B408 [Puccinia triticina]|nr:hypothetical protein PtB15_16B408 [Puccinia triticina]
MHIVGAIGTDCHRLLKTEAFESNTITTGWLDTLISANMTAERPDNTLAVICGAVTKAHLQTVAASDEYKRILDKGQVPDKNLLRTAPVSTPCSATAERSASDCAR